MQPPRFGEQSSDEEESDGTDEEEEAQDFRPTGLTRRGRLQKLERQLKKGREAAEDGEETEDSGYYSSDNSSDWCTWVLL